MKNLTIIVPAYNEENRIKKTLNKYISFFNDKNIDYEILAVLNGCIDNTLEKVSNLSSQHNTFRFINIPEAIGKGGAIKEGIRNSEAEYVGFVDADCSVEPEEFYKLYKAIEDGEYDCAISSRYIKGANILIKQPIQRVIASRIFNLIVKTLFLMPFKDTQCGGKIMKREPLIPVLGHLRITDWAFDVNLLYLLRKKGLKIKEVPINWKDAPGSQLSLKRVSPMMLLSVLRLRMIYSPLSLFSRQLGSFTGTITNYFKKGDEKVLFSIIIPFKKLDSEVHECIDGCLSQSYPNYEIILLPDDDLKHINFNTEKIKTISTGSVKPSIKRNLGIENSKGNIIAFIDSDATPKEDWLNIAAKAFTNDSSIGILGGPNLDKKDASAFEKASSDILSSRIAAGKFALRYSEGNECEVEELPSCNLFVRKNILAKHNIKFDDNLLTAEDSKLCFDVANTGAKVIYNPKLHVFHRRRELFFPHMKQMWIYGRDKATLIKKQKVKNSLLYFLPSFFVIFNIAGLTGSFFNKTILIFYLSITSLYLIIIAISSLRKIKTAYLVFLGTILTHFSYGSGFLYGLAKKVRI